MTKHYRVTRTSFPFNIFVGKATTMHPEADRFFMSTERWNEPMRLLRHLLVESGLTEDWKWNHPCYTLNGGNVVMIGNFKNYCTLSFFKGALLNDQEGLLARAGEHSHHVRMLRITDADQVLQHEPVLKAMINQAMEIERSGEKIVPPADAVPEHPAELTEAFRAMPALQQAFESLTPGRQRAYLLHFSSAKQSSTRADRIQKYTSRILHGKGIADCVCGFSGRMPTCDGTHKKKGVSNMI